MVSPKNQTYQVLIKEFEKNCLGNGTVTRENDLENSKLFCHAVFDGVMCWGKTEAGETAKQSCSSNYLIRSSSDGTATLICEKSGQWFTKYKNMEATANYTQCGKFYVRHPLYDEEEDIYTKWLPILRKCTHLGYTVSIISLFLALLVFIYLKRLHCARNYLHMHLFVSSIMRCSMSLLKDLLFVRGTTLVTETSYEHGVPTFRKETFWLCKAIISFRQYFILTNYMMLLMEGVYLHNLIFLKLFSDKTSVKGYATVGWALPLLFIIPWVILRIVNESFYCWTTKDKTSLLIDIPIGAIVFINFVLFLLIVRILCLKLNSIFLQQRKVKYRKLVKATLILLPLFGVPYTISVILSFYVNQDKTLEIIWLFFDQSFTAFQGFLAALAYCLLNSDVQSEIRRRYHSVREKNDLRRCRTISHTLQSVVTNGEDVTEIQQCTIVNGKMETEF